MASPNYSIRDTRFTLISIKTLDDTQSGAAVIGVACVKIHASKIERAASWLINPSTLLPEEFSRQTGLYVSDLNTQPKLETVLPDIAAFIERDFIIWSGHPKRTNAALKHFRLTQPKDKELFLQTLAQKLLPDLKKHTIVALAQHFDVDTDRLLRAESHAQASAEVFIHLLQQLEEAHDVTTLEDLLNFNPAVKPMRARTRYDLPFDRDRLKHYPTAPGVYFMKNRLGEILYVGKAKNLRSRLRSYFQKQSALPAKVSAMMKQVTQIDTTVVGSELEALLLEARLIKLHQPFFNKKVKNYKRLVFMKVSVQETYPRISMACDTEDEPMAVYFGPFQSQAGLDERMEILNRAFKLRTCNNQQFAVHSQSPCMQYPLGLCSGPCAKLTDERAYREQVDDFLRYLSKQPCHTIDYLQTKRDAYADALLFEKAARVQQHLELLEEFQRHSGELVRAAAQHHCLIVLPSGHPEAPDAFRILGVLQGQPHCWYTFNPQTDSYAALASVVDDMLIQFESVQSDDSQTNIPKLFYEEARLLADWIENHSPEEGMVIPLSLSRRDDILQRLIDYVADASQGLSANPKTVSATV